MDTPEQPPEAREDSETRDWRELEQQLNELPDDKLLHALQNAGVKAVLPSHKKPPSRRKRPGQRGDATARWTAGDWMDRVDVTGLTEAGAQAEGDSAEGRLADVMADGPPADASKRSPVVGMALGALAAVGLIAGGLWLWHRHTDARPLTATSPPAPQEVKPPPEPVLAAPEAKKAGGGAEPGARARRQPRQVTASGEDYQVSDAQLRRYERAARRGNARAMYKTAVGYIERENAHKAVRWAKKAFKADRRNVATRILLGDAYQLAGDDVMAEKTWRRGLKRAPRNAALRRRLGLAK